MAARRAWVLSVAQGCRGVLPDKKKPRETPRHLEALLAEIIYFISSPAQEFERTQIDLDASEAPSPFRDSWESYPRLLISPTSNEDLQPAVLRTTRKPPALTHLRLQLAACALKSGWVSKRAFSALLSPQRPSAVLLGTKMKTQRPELKK